MNIQLPGFVIADLYKNSLVVLPEAEEVAAAPEVLNTPAAAVQPPIYMGSNRQRITVVVHNNSHPFIGEESLQLLSNLLAALQYTLDDVAIINHHHTPVDFAYVGEQLQPRVCLLFGTTTQALKLPFIIPNYQLQQYAGCTFLQACSIEEMNTNDDDAKAEKRKLWNCLKTVFNK